MPTYVYEFCRCEAVLERHREFDKKYPNATTFDTFELNVPIEQRDEPKCHDCGTPLKRRIAFNGLTWAPTAGGMR